MSRAHTDAVLALVTAAPGTTYDADVPANPTMPYRVVFTDDGLDEATTIEGNPNQLTVRITVTAAGLTRASAQIAQGAAHGALAGVVPTVTGRVCGVISHVNSRKVDVDKDVTPHRFYAVNEYEFISVPA